MLKLCSLGLAPCSGPLKCLTAWPNAYTARRRTGLLMQKPMLHSQGFAHCNRHPLALLPLPTPQTIVPKAGSQLQMLMPGSQHSVDRYGCHNIQLPLLML
eukprot:gnl/MRDRNA2_/MRDRNA2_301658_c1_seq1.p1 gnl/MRDRNA2_/MRDRNA2_301658_c1~~gnl/MRDRNA2_/MRDRNA2_301658_c1_seq1.p1  ORF type:complete len:100 (-),score=3.69 gnl/MRDRNA2_/MRDRNA2_301658_c1_seq1:40-339(-)